MYKFKRTASYLIGIILSLLIIASCNLFKTNTPPTITSTPPTQINESSEYSYIVQAEDPDEDALIYTLETKPAWLSLSGHTITGTAPEVTADQNYTVKVKVSDGEEFDSQQFTITVKDVPEENHAPQITSTPITQVNERSTYEYYVQAEDADEDDLIYSITSGPSWLSVSGSRIYGTAPEVDQDSSVAISVRVSDGIEHDDQSFNLLIINVPDPTVSQTVLLVNEVDIAYSGHLKDVDSAVRQIYHNDILIDSLTTTINSRAYSDTLKGNMKGNWKFVLSADGAISDEITIEVPNYDPTAELSIYDPIMGFEYGEVLALPLPTAYDVNPEDNPVITASVESLDNKISSRIVEDSLYLTNKKGAIEIYSIKLHFGSEANGKGEATLSGEITAPTIFWFNPFKRPAKGTYHYGSGDANQDGFIDSLDTEAISNGTQVDEADVNGDGIISYKDEDLLEDYIEGSISYLPGHFHKLTTKEERNSWVEKILLIDKTDEKHYEDTGNDTTEWVSGNYASQICINTFGYYDNELAWEKYDLSNNRRFNFPICYVSSVRS